MISTINKSEEANARINELIQNDFSGGMNLLQEDTSIADNEYRLAFNVRNRFNNLAQIKKPTDITGALADRGTLQGAYNVGAYLVVFINGEMWYRYATANNWTQVEGFQMSTTATRIYAKLVPASNQNFLRKLADATDNSAVDIDPSFVITGTVRAMLVQDGINQPLIVQQAENGAPAVRVSQTYAQWGSASREYVPIGLDMMEHDGILYTVSPDRKRLYRSVTGRFLDFVINVDSNGDKGGDAETTAYAVGYDNITAINPVSSESFIVSTDGSASYIVTPNRDVTVFGEPTFRRQPLMDTGALNSFSFVDILGDNAFIDSKGVKSFNAVLQLMNEGKNSVFSLKVSPAFYGIIQNSDESAAITFDNYAFFAMNSRYGHTILVYDILSKTHVCFDSTASIKVKQFVSLLPFYEKLYCITVDGKIYEMFSSDEYAMASVDTKRISGEKLNQEQRFSQALCVFTQPIESDGMVTLCPNVDGKFSSGVTKPIKKYPGGILYPAAYPVTYDNFESPNRINFIASNPRRGWKIGARIKWSGGAKLTHFMLSNELDTPMSSSQQRSLTFQ